MKNRIVTKEEWLTARKNLLEKEKELTRLKDQLSQSIRALPWVKIDKNYTFESHTGQKSFADLFEERSQLIVYHFMMGPDWEEGCKSCSFWADNFNDITVHLNQRDVTMIAISRAPVEKINAFKQRMNWKFDWYSSLPSDFNFDFQVSFHEGEEGMYNFAPLAAGAPRELPGISVFYKDQNGSIYHTYSRYSRGLDLFNTAYHYLDIVPKGRDEDQLPFSMAWLKHHDRY